MGENYSKLLWLSLRRYSLRAGNPLSCGSTVLYCGDPPPPTSNKQCAMNYSSGGNWECEGECSSYFQETIQTSFATDDGFENSVVAIAGASNNYFNPCRACVLLCFRKQQLEGNTAFLQERSFAREKQQSKDLVDRELSIAGGPAKKFFREGKLCFSRSGVLR